MADQSASRTHDFAEVFAAELAQISAARRGTSLETNAADGERAAGGGRPARADAYARAHALQLTGLAFSGGGIRSATFNLGLVQALSEAKLLRCFDYLSTVSGGGYVGSWVSAQLHQRHWPRGITPRHTSASGIPASQATSAIAAVEALEGELSPTTAGQPKAQEAKSITYLRQYSNYLTPRVGLLSTDSLAGIASYLRNVLLIQATVIALLITVLMLPRLLYSLAVWYTQPFGWTGIALLFASALGIGINLRAGKDSIWARTGFVLWLVIVPAVVGALLLAVDLSQPRTIVDAIVERGSRLLGLSATDYPAAVWWSAVMALVYGGLCLVLAVLGAPSKLTPIRWLLLIVIASLVAGALGGASLYVVRWMMIKLGLAGAAPLWFAISVAPFAVLMAFSLMIIAQLGLIGRVFDFQLHEWFARYGAWIFAVTIGVGGIFSIAVYGPMLIEYTRWWLMYAGGPVWLVTTLWGVWAGNSGKTSGTEGAGVSAPSPGAAKISWTERLLPIAPYVFIFGLALALAYSIHILMPAEHPAEVSGTLSEATARVTYAMAHPTWPWAPWAAAALFLAVFVLFAWRVDINLFSFHNFYRNRITRCYLGAARAASGLRKPHPFTGFDIDDDIALADLVTADDTVQRPYHILNTALNMSTGKNLAWQQRKAGAFFFSPLYCGFELPGSLDASGGTGAFVPTKDYMHTKSAFGPAHDSSPMLGSVVATSGAAASPNAGFHTSSAVAFLLTLFNVRLGRWCPNPAYQRMPHWQSPTFGGGLLLQELFASTDECSKWIYLSDGGHFENLAIYELVRRRMKIIVVGDCGQDALPMHFDDLGDAVRKCHTDFGVSIVLDVDPLNTQTAEEARRFSLKQVVAGKIYYPACGDAPAFEGTLFLVKPTLAASIFQEAPDIRNYALANVAFPQQSTADQWFNEAQFEAYRKLGYLIGRDHLMTCKDLDGRTLQDLLACGLSH